MRHSDCTRSAYLFALQLSSYPRVPHLTHRTRTRSRPDAESPTKCFENKLKHKSPSPRILLWHLIRASSRSNKIRSRCVKHPTSLSSKHRLEYFLLYKPTGSPPTLPTSSTSTVLSIHAHRLLRPGELRLHVPPIPYSQGRRLRCTADIVIKGASGWSTPRLEFNLRLTCERRSRDGLIESSEHVIVDISGLVASRIGRRQRDFRHQADIWRSDVTGIYYKICLYYIMSCPCGLYT